MRWKSSARRCYLVTSAKSAWSSSSCVCVWASEWVGAGLLNTPIHKPPSTKKTLLLLNWKNHWRINTQSGCPQEQIHSQADVSMQNFGKRPETLNVCFLENGSLITIYRKCTCYPMVCWVFFFFCHEFHSCLFTFTIPPFNFCQFHKIAQPVHKTGVSIELLKLSYQKK